MGNSGSSDFFTIAASHVFDGAAMRGPGSVRISNGRIENICFGKLDTSASIRLPDDALLAPGFIDVQVNGGGGVLLNDQPTEVGVRRIVEAHRKAGTTGKQDRGGKLIVPPATLSQATSNEATCWRPHSRTK